MSDKSICNSDSFSNPKTNASLGKKEQTQSITIETSIETLTQSVKRSCYNGVGLFDDLCSLKEEKLPTLNHMVQLSMNEGSSSFSVNLSSCDLKQSKLLDNFLYCTETSDLLSLGKLLDRMKSDFESQLLKSSDQARV